MADIEIPLSSMEELSRALAATITELGDAANNQDALESAIGSPCGKGDLRGAANEFESAWDDKRGKLKGDLESTRQKVDDVKSSWQKLDQELGRLLEKQ